MKVMFICTGNMCRSVMAEVIFKTMVDESVDVCSAGIYAKTGKSASKNTIEVCRLHGLDASGHRATNIRDSRIDEMDLILTATCEHKRCLTEKLKESENIYTIKEYAGLSPLDIHDPYGYDLDCYESCFNEIYDALKKIKL